jgi:hypothetical protein
MTKNINIQKKIKRKLFTFKMIQNIKFKTRGVKLEYISRMKNKLAKHEKTLYNKE